MRIAALVVVGSVIFLKDQIAAVVPFLGIIFWPHSLMTGLIADAVTLLGTAVMIWSRSTLGSNWSANVVFKEDHELVTHGPYAYARHPIYSGLLLMVLGVAIYAGNSMWFSLFTLFFIGAYYKAHKEERLLTMHFPEEYPVYVKRVRAIIPFVF